MRLRLFSLTPIFIDNLFPYKFQCFFILWSIMLIEQPTCNCKRYVYSCPYNTPIIITVYTTIAILILRGLEVLTNQAGKSITVYWFNTRYTHLQQRLLFFSECVACAEGTDIEFSCHSAGMPNMQWIISCVCIMLLGDVGTYVLQWLHSVLNLLNLFFFLLNFKN